MFSVVRDGTVVTSAAAHEIMGGPLNSLRWLVGALTRKGVTLEAGSFVIPGSPVELVVVDADCSICVSIEDVGRVEMLFRQAYSVSR